MSEALSAHCGPGRVVLKTSPVKPGQTAWTISIIPRSSWPRKWQCRTKAPV